MLNPHLFFFVQKCMFDSFHQISRNFWINLPMEPIQVFFLNHKSVKRYPIHLGWGYSRQLVFLWWDESSLAPPANQIAPFLNQLSNALLRMCEIH